MENRNTKFSDGVFTPVHFFVNSTPFTALLQDLQEEVKDFKQ